MITTFARLSPPKMIPERRAELAETTAGFRAGMKEVTVEAGDLADCVGALGYAYDHEARDLARRLTRSHHHHYDISIAHVHLDPDRCLEVHPEGKTGDVRHFAVAVTSQRAVAYRELKIIPDKQS